MANKKNVMIGTEMLDWTSRKKTQNFRVYSLKTLF